MERKKRQSQYMHKQEEWKKLYESGLSFTQIGKQEGLHYTTIQTVLKEVVTPRPKETYAHMMEKWVELYTSNEWSANEIAQADGVDTATVTKYLKKAGVNLRRKVKKTSLFETVVSEWIKLYEEPYGLSLQEIADQYHTYPQTVHKHIKDKVQMREYAETSRLYSIKHADYFNNIDTHQKAYWLGIWFGTGFISRQIGGYECTLVVSLKDKNTLERFRKTIGYEKPVNLVKGKGFDQTHSGQVAKLRINNREIYKALLAQGLINNKGDELRFPIGLEEEFYNSFVLGYYEGKGSCYNTRSKDKKGRVYTQTTLTFFGTEMFLDELLKIMASHTNVSMYKGSSTNLRDGKEYVIPHIQISAREGIVKIANWLYQYAEDFSKIRDIKTILKERG
ncbi:hypothetical protein ACFVS2_20735 [Brevibacillus sp. NPDC058079]|uniref:hypothetical protein n=1 Tax=Brevibacillus sp. NPDC058079 TaxID=3346330 RepID=UPI0036E999E5